MHAFIIYQQASDKCDKQSSIIKSSGVRISFRPSVRSSSNWSKSLSHVLEFPRSDPFTKVVLSICGKQKLFQRHMRYLVCSISHGESAVCWWSYVHSKETISISTWYPPEAKHHTLWSYTHRGASIWVAAGVRDEYCLHGPFEQMEGRNTIRIDVASAWCRSQAQTFRYRCHRYCQW